jgi:hypothetical protein
MWLLADDGPLDSFSELMAMGVENKERSIGGERGGAGRDVSLNIKKKHQIRTKR